ncbi:biopolymer transporter ExbD [Hymenobacter lutimineralis]|uniref:Biopolymer transporter ExbD n=1 Tax=Hymenobacter lutimineralis TaxID=2606448 RepID=A0A5D6VC13_9BACT|nr:MULTISPECIES: biopolymer transporter ExbD [Hymenobacter]QIX62032.1 biopolymer transporter ExbD [Hymenobacter sp. BT18]TYZ12458.1 biopolymer transporter ExbD [Hymenobacter lutimineralis]
MPKVKPHRTSPSLDMTPMVDLAFLLVTFFMLTTKFAPEEVVIVDTPSSTSEIKLPESNVIRLLIDKDKRVFFGLESDKARALLLDRMGAKYGVSFTEKQKRAFGGLNSFGVPVQQLGSLLDMSTEKRKEVKQPGLLSEADTVQLIDWVMTARQANMDAVKKPTFIAIKGDNDADVATVRRVIQLLQNKNINRFNLITDLENKPVVSR